MFIDVRVIGQAIEREIEGDFHAAFPHLFLKPVKISERPQRRLDRLMPTGVAADRPWHARIARLGRDCVVPPLAVGVTNRMNRRKIKNVESHGLYVVYPRQTIAESRSAVAPAFCRARKKFIP